MLCQGGRAHGSIVMPNCSDCCRASRVPAKLSQMQTTIVLTGKPCCCRTNACVSLMHCNILKLEVDLPCFNGVCLSPMLPSAAGSVAQATPRSQLGRSQLRAAP